jgi:hypothetical protein
MLARKLHSSLVGLGSAVAEKALAAECPLGKQLGKFALLGDIERIVDVEQLACLSADSFNDLGMAVSDSTYGPAGEHIENLIAVRVKKVIALAPDDDLGQAAVVGNDVFVKQLNYFISVHS